MTYILRENRAREQTAKKVSHSFLFSYVLFAYTVTSWIRSDYIFNQQPPNGYKLSLGDPYDHMPNIYATKQSRV